MAELKKENKRLEEEYWNGFPMTKEEYGAIKNWKNNGHRHADAGVSGGGLEYIFIPTGIGCIGKVRCICGAEFCFREIC